MRHRLSDCEEYFKKADTHNQDENCTAKPAQTVALCFSDFR